MSIFDKKLNEIENNLRYINGKLTIEGIPLEKIAKELGTPIFVFSAKRIIDNLKTFSLSFKKYVKNVYFFYPYRANYLPHILNLIHRENWGAETVSSFEYKLAKRVSAPSIILNGFNKRIYEKVLNDEKLFYIVIDSFEDLVYLNEIGKRLNKTIGVGIRIHPHLKTFQNQALIPLGFKLGYDIKSGDAERVIKKASKLSNVRIVALNTHIAIRQVTPSLHAVALQSLISFADNICSKYHLDIKYINIGGGFETRSLLEEESSIEKFAVEFKKVLLASKKEYSLILEPGRYIINDAGIVITQIISQKTNCNRKWLITDVGVNTLIPLKSASYDVIPLINNDKRLAVYDIGDHIASSIGVIKRNVQLPAMTSTGMYLVILYAGAYTLSMAEQFCLLKPAVVLVDKENTEILKKKENVDSFIDKLLSESW